MEALNLNPGDPNYFIRSEDRKTFKEFKDKKAKATCAHLSIPPCPAAARERLPPAKIVSHLPILSPDVPLLTGTSHFECPIPHLESFLRLTPCDSLSACAWTRLRESLYYGPEVQSAHCLDF